MIFPRCETTITLVRSTIYEQRQRPAARVRSWCARAVRLLYTVVTRALVCMSYPNHAAVAVAVVVIIVSLFFPLYYSQGNPVPRELTPLRLERGKFSKVSGNFSIDHMKQPMKGCWGRELYDTRVL